MPGLSNGDHRRLTASDPPVQVSGRGTREPRYGARVHSVEVVASKGIAFGYLAELHYAEWRTGVREMRLISASPYQLGARHQEVRRLLGRDMLQHSSSRGVPGNERIDFRRATGWLRPR
jgi:hypothetical protein